MNERNEKTIPFLITSSTSIILNRRTVTARIIEAAGMMTACAVYATYVFAGNDGRLAPSGTAKVAAAFQQQLDQVQRAKAASQDKA